MSVFGGALGGVVGGAVVKLTLDKSQFDQGLAQARGQTEAGATSMGKFSGAAKAGFAIAGAAALKFGADSLKAFMDSEQGMAQFQNTLSMMPQLAGETTAAFEDQAHALQNLTGYQDEEIISADNILARFNLTAEQIRQAIPIVLDYARATGQDVPAAAQNIGKALLGNTRALKTVGIEYTATGNTAKDFNDILGLLSGKVGGAAEAFGETLPGKLEIARAKIDDLKESVGALEGSFALLLTGDVKSAASMWVQVANATDEANAAFQRFTTPVLDASQATGELSAAQSSARTEMQHMTAEQYAAIDAMNATQTPAEQAAWATAHLADENARAAQEARNLYAAQMTLAGGLLGVQGASLSAAQAQDRLQEANANVNKLAADGKKGTEEYRDALLEQDQAALDAVQSQASLVQSVQDYVEANHHSKAATADAIDMIRQYARDAGLTKEQTRELIGTTLEQIDTYKKVPQSVKTDVILNGADAAINNINTIKARIDALHDKEVNIYVYTHYKQDI